MKNLITLVIAIIIVNSGSAQLTKGNFFGSIQGQGFTNDADYIEQYAIPDSLVTSNTNLKIAFGLNYALTNYISIGLYSRHINKSSSTYKKNEYGPTLRVHFPVKFLDKMKIFSNSAEYKMDDFVYLKNMLYIEGSALFGIVYHDSISFDNDGLPLPMLAHAR